MQHNLIQLLAYVSELKLSIFLRKCRFFANLYRSATTVSAPLFGFRHNDGVRSLFG
jgi:hypothetical protein